MATPWYATDSLSPILINGALAEIRFFYVKHSAPLVFAVIASGAPNYGAPLIN